VLQLTLLVAGTLAAVIAVLFGVGYQRGREMLRNQIHDRLAAVAESRRDYVAEWVGRQRDRVDIFATRQVFSVFLQHHLAGQPEEPERRYSQDNLAGHLRLGAALGARIVDLDGRVLLSSDAEEVGRDLTGDPIFQGGLKTPTVGLPERVGQRFVAEIAAPTPPLEGSAGAVGVVMLTVDVTPLAKALRNTTGLGETGEVLLGVQQQRERIHLLFPPRHEKAGGDLPLAAMPALAAALAGREAFVHTRDYRGEPVLAMARPVGSGGWGLVVKMDEAEAYAPIGAARNQMLALAAGVGLLGLAGAYGVARAFTRPIRRLAAAAEAVGGGDLTVSVPVRSGNEMGALTATFNEMLAALRTRSEERAQADAALAAERTLLRTLIDVLPVSIYVKDRESRFLVANEAAAHSIGAATSEEVLGRMDADYFPPALAAAFRENDQQVLAGEAVLNLEHDSTYPDGTARTELTTKVPLRDEAGEIIGLVGVSRDITEHKQAQDALRENEALLRSITDNTDDIIFVKDRQSRTIFKNPAGLRANALPPQWVLGRSDVDFNPDPAQTAKFLANDRRVMETGQTLTVEEMLTAATGEQHVLLTTKTPRYDAEGKVIGLVGIAHDITARKRAEAALEAERGLLRTLIDVLPVSIYVKDTRSRFLVANDECARAVGAASPEELLGKTDADFFPPELAAAFREDERKVLAGESVVNLEEASVHPDGTARTELTTKVPLRDEAGAIIGLVGVSRDISERKQADEALRASEALLRSITDHTEDCIFVKDRESRTIFMNPAGFRANALPPETLLGHSDAEFIEDPAEAEKFLAHDRRVMESGQTETVEEELTSATGEKRVLLTTKAPRFDSAGNVIGLVGVARDITAQKAAENALRESEQRLRSIIEAEPECVKVISRQGKLLEMNAAGLAMLDAARLEEVSTKPLLSFIASEHHSAFMALHHQVMAGKAATLGYETIGLKGTRRWLETHAVPLRDAAGNVTALLGVTRDVTAQKQAEAALRESHERYELVVAGADAAIWDWDVRAKRVYYSRRWKELRGYAEDEISDREEEWSSRIHDADSARVIAALRAHVEGSAPVFAEEYRIRCKDGSWKWVLDRGIALRDEAGQAVRVAGSETDITERKRAEEELKASLHEKEVLLREVHHRVKNNLQIVSSLLNLQSRQLTDPALTAIFANTRDRVRAMASVHERLYESGDFAEVDLARHLGVLVRMLTRAHAPAGVTIQPVLQLEPVTVDLNTAVPLSLIANELIINALKYAFAGNREGTFTVALRADGAHCELRIADDGPGFPEALDPATTRTLGLRLVRDLAKQIRAQLEIDSTAAGTNIVLRWPARLVVSEPAAPIAETLSPEI
jgi:PAS domain S-box-containing protein